MHVAGGTIVCRMDIHVRRKAMTLSKRRKLYLDSQSAMRRCFARISDMNVQVTGIATLDRATAIYNPSVRDGTKGDIGKRERLLELGRGISASVPQAAVVFIWSQSQSVFHGLCINARRSHFFSPVIQHVANDRLQRGSAAGMNQSRDFMSAVKQLLEERTARIGESYTGGIQIAADRRPWEIMAFTVQLLEVSRQH